MRARLAGDSLPVAVEAHALPLAIAARAIPLAGFAERAHTLLTIPVAVRAPPRAVAGRALGRAVAGRTKLNVVVTVGALHGVMPPLAGTCAPRALRPRRPGRLPVSGRGRRVPSGRAPLACPASTNRQATTAVGQLRGGTH